MDTKQAFDGENTREQIELEKAMKPRADLIPFTAIEEIESALETVDLEEARVVSVGTIVRRAWEDLAAFAKYQNAEVLACAGANLAIAIAKIDCVPLDIALQHAALRAGHVQGYGRRKHGRCTWRVFGTEQSLPETHVASATRHVIEYEIDPDAIEGGSRLPVLLHAFAQDCIAIDCAVDPARPETQA